MVVGFSYRGGRTPHESLGTLRARTPPPGLVCLTHDEVFHCLDWIGRFVQGDEFNLNGVGTDGALWYYVRQGYQCQTGGFQVMYPSFEAGTPVKVQRSGNSKVLPIPAAVCRQEQVETGEPYVLEVIGDGFLFRRSGPRVAVLQIGGESIGVIPDDALTSVPPASSLPPLDWDF